MKKKVLGIFFSYALIVLDIIASIVIVPILLNGLGDSEYGLFRLMTSTAAYLSVLDFGIGGTITRYVVKYKTEKDRISEENFIAMGLIIYAVLSIILVLLAVVITFIIPVIYSNSIPAEQYGEAKMVFFIICSTTAVSLFNHAYNGLLQAYESFTYNKISNIIKLVFRFSLIVFGLRFFKSAITVAIIDFILAILLLICNIIFVAFRLKCRIKLHKWRWELAKEAGVFTVAILLQSIINQFNSNIDNIVLGVFSTTGVIAMYSIVLQFYSMFGNLSTAISSVYLPSISSAVFMGESDDEITERVIAPSRIQLAVLLLALTGFYLFGQQFISLWVGDNYSSVYFLSTILLTSSIFDLSQNTITSVLKAKNKLHGKTLILLFATVTNAVLTFVLVPVIGAYGAVIGTAFSLLFGYGLALNIYYKNVIHLKMKKYYLETYKGILPAAVIAAVLGILISAFLDLHGWLGFIVKVVIYSVIYATLMYLIGLNMNEKSLVKKVLAFGKKAKRQ